VKKHGNNWVAVATLVPGRTRDQCSQRWTRTLDPSNGKNAGKWTPDEDAKLTKAVKKYGKDWVAVAALVPGRSNVQCYQRWTKNLDPSRGKNAGKWNSEEDAKLTEAVKKHGNNWVAVATLVPGRTRDQCRERWVNTVDPVNGSKGNLRCTWKPEDDTKLAEAVKKHGKNWVAVAASVSGRTNVQCRRRWTSSLDPANGKKGKKWTPAEDTKLTEAVKKHGNDWVAVAAMVPGRTNVQCRYRWVKYLDPNRASNTVEEEEDPDRR
jgi:myb proto-oncogene protein